MEGLKSLIKELLEMVAEILVFILKVFVFLKFWNWFIISNFNAPALNFAEIAGLLFFLKIPFLLRKEKIISFSKQAKEEIKNGDKKFTVIGEEFIIQILASVFFLFVGWIIFQFT